MYIYIYMSVYMCIAHTQFYISKFICKGAILQHGVRYVARSWNIRSKDQCVEEVVKEMFKWVKQIETAGKVMQVKRTRCLSKVPDPARVQLPPAKNDQVKVERKATKAKVIRMVTPGAPSDKSIEPPVRAIQTRSRAVTTKPPAVTKSVVAAKTAKPAVRMKARRQKQPVAKTSAPKGPEPRKRKLAHAVPVSTKGPTPKGPPWTTRVAMPSTSVSEASSSTAVHTVGPSGSGGNGTPDWIFLRKPMMRQLLQHQYNSVNSSKVETTLTSERVPTT
jgi:hypothetical protein